MEPGITRKRLFIRVCPLWRYRLRFLVLRTLFSYVGQPHGFWIPEGRCKKARWNYVGGSFAPYVGCAQGGCRSSQPIPHFAACPQWPSDLNHSRRARQRVGTIGARFPRQITDIVIKDRYQTTDGGL